jgi:hypothetical protein
VKRAVGKQAVERRSAAAVVAVAAVAAHVLAVVVVVVALEVVNETETAFALADSLSAWKAEKIHLTDERVAMAAQMLQLGTQFVAFAFAPA